MVRGGTAGGGATTVVSLSGRILCALTYPFFFFTPLVKQMKLMFIIQSNI